MIKQLLHTLKTKGLRYTVRAGSRHLVARFMSPFIVSHFKELSKNISDLYEAVDFAFSFKYLEVSIKPSQVRYEITKLLELVAGLKPRVVLEIGTAEGGTLFLFTRVAKPDATLISVDLPGGPFGGGYPKWKIPLYLSFTKCSQKVHLIRRSSHEPQTLEEVKGILGAEKVDFLFIDGDHSYEGVRKDFEMYSPLVGKGGIIAFHDIVPGPSENVGGVPKFWNEIKHDFNCREIVSDWRQGGYGIGVLYV